MYASRDMSNIAEFSLFSVMRYVNILAISMKCPDLGFRNIMPAEMNIQRQDILPNFMLTDFDKAFVSINYPRASASPETPEWTFEHALDVAGVAARHKQWILDSPTIDAIRQRFSLWRVTQVTDRDDPLPHAPSRSSSAHLEDTTPDDSPIFCAAEEDLAPVAPISTRAGVARAVEGFDRSRSKTKLWAPGTIITFYFMQPNDPIKFAPRRMALLQTFQLYQDTLRLSFQEVSDPMNARVFVEFRPENDTKGPDSWSLIGTDHKRHTTKAYPPAMVGTTLYLKFSLDNTPWESIHRQANLFHEVGHVLGLKHEHESPATETVDNPAQDTGTHTRFDPRSVMLYRGHRFRDGSPLQVSGRDETVLNSFPSPIDLAFLLVCAVVFFCRLKQKLTGAMIGDVPTAIQAFLQPSNQGRYYRTDPDSLSHSPNSCSNDKQC